jgi:hypothetical protein
MIFLKIKKKELIYKVILYNLKFILPLCRLKAAVSEKEDISYDLFLSILKK